MTIEFRNISGRYFIHFSPVSFSERAVSAGEKKQISLWKRKKRNTAEAEEKAQHFKKNVLLLEDWKQRGAKVIFAQVEDSTPFSSPLGAEMFVWGKKIQQMGLEFDTSLLPQTMKEMMTLAFNSGNIPPAEKNDKAGFLEKIGQKSYQWYQQTRTALQFMRETNASVWRFITGKAIFRSRDFWFIFGDCSYKAVGIISLVSFLVGLILAFVGALQLRTFGAGIFVASMVALGMTRIMAAIMVGIIMAGRTGSSYAATLGTMQVNEEIDALKTLGVKITDYLVAPRQVALVLTIPFLTMLADVLGILGGAVVGIGFLDISSSSYFDYSTKALHLDNILIGLLHSVVYGVIISTVGCYEGLKAGRDADSVGKATTNAVVVSLVLMIIATGILTIILETAGL